MEIQYDKRTDRHIYIAGGARNALEWIEVSIAAADQAGMSTGTQAILRKIMLNQRVGIDEPQDIERHR